MQFIYSFLLQVYITSSIRKEITLYVSMYTYMCIPFFPRWDQWIFPFFSISSPELAAFRSCVKDIGSSAFSSSHTEQRPLVSDSSWRRPSAESRRARCSSSRQLRHRKRMLGITRVVPSQSSKGLMVKLPCRRESSLLGSLGRVGCRLSTESVSSHAGWRPESSGSCCGRGVGCCGSATEPISVEWRWYGGGWRRRRRRVMVASWGWRGGYWARRRSEARKTTETSGRGHTVFRGGFQTVQSVGLSTSAPVMAATGAAARSVALLLFVIIVVFSVGMHGGGRVEVLSRWRAGISVRSW